MTQACEQCGEVGFIRTDALQNCTVCTSCGHIIDECSVVGEKDLEGTSFLSSSLLHGGNSRVPTFRAQRQLGLRWNPSTRRGEGLRAAAKSIPALISAIGLQQSFAEDAKAILGQVISSPNVPKWKSMKLLAAACIYAACKRQRKPIGLVDISNAANLDRYQFAKFFKKLSEHLKKPIPKELLAERERTAATNTNIVAAVDLDNLISRVCENALKDVITDSSTRQKISSTAAKMARLAQQEFLLGTGRNPGSVAAAAIAVSGSIFGFHCKEKKATQHRVLHTFPSPPPTSGSTEVSNQLLNGDGVVDSDGEDEASESDSAEGHWNSDFVILCEQLNVAMTTVETRKRELEDFLIKKARGLSLPWANSINRSNLQFYLPSLIRHFEFASIAKQGGSGGGLSLSSSSTSSSSSPLLPNPPAFSRQENQRRKRATKIEEAKERLESRRTGLSDNKQSVHLNLSEEDKLIEKCLLEGISEKDIMEGHYNSLLSESAMQKRGNDMSMEDEELGENDISEKDMREFLRTPEEMMKLKSLLSST
eukprot:TRINITY_DN8272_c0_g1_i2.p1 TRINITY_DN8272_c0_g1~~TRINITY_DN8272_c0_g1_i2.p1  ORF type:complete len:537 (-),score=115.92 TRINITY_DN8272_c0_g1_i2:151-1761(-)